jgi:hypothetical protein
MNDPQSRPRAPGSGLRRTLDQEIDQVAARMVGVDHDAAMADRIVARLPERPARGPWLGVLLPQAAAAVAILAAVVMWTTREPAVDPNTDVGRAAASLSAEAPGAKAEAPAETEAGAQAPDLQASVSSLSTVEPALLPDHERALAPVAAPISIELAAIEAPALLDEPTLVLAPLVLTELPLSGESNSPY